MIVIVKKLYFLNGDENITSFTLLKVSTKFVETFFMFIRLKAQIDNLLKFQ